MNTISLITQKNKNFYSNIINRYSITKGNYLGYLLLFFKRNQVLSPQVNKITYVKNEYGNNARKIVVNNYFTNKLFIKNSLFFLNQIAYKNASPLNRISHSDYSSFGQACNWGKSSYFSLNRLVFKFNKCFEEIKSKEVYQLQGEEKSPVYIGDLEKCYISKGLIVNRESFLVKENTETIRNRLGLHFVDNKTFYKGKQKIIQRVSFEENSRRYCSEEIFRIKEEILKNYNIEERIYKNSINSIMRNMELTKELRVNDYEKRVEERVAAIREISNSKISTIKIRNSKISNSNIENSKMITGNIRNNKLITSNIRNNKMITSKVTELEEQFIKYIAETVRWTNSKKIQRETLNIVKYATRKESTEERIYQLYFKNKNGRREQELKNWSIEERIYRNSIDRIMRNMELTKELRVNEYEKRVEERVAAIREISNSKISTIKIRNSKISNSNIENSKMITCNIRNNKLNTSNKRNNKMITSKVTELEEQFIKYIAETVRWTNSKKNQRETETLNLVKYGTRKESTEERIYQLYFKNNYNRREQELKNWTIEERIYRNSIDRIMRNMELTKELRVNEYKKFVEERVADIREIKSNISTSKISNSNIKTGKKSTSKVSNSNIKTSNIKNSKIIASKVTELEEKFFKHIAEKIRWANSEKIQRETETLNIVKYGTRKESTEERIYQLYFKNKYGRREQELKNWTIEDRIYRNSIDRIMRNIELTKELRVNEYERFLEERVADIREIKNSSISASKISDSNIKTNNIETSNISTSRLSNSNIKTSKVTELKEQFFKYIAEKVRWTNSEKIQRETETLNLVKYGTRKESTEERIYQLYFKNKYSRREQELKNWTIEERIYRNSINSIMRNIELTQNIRGKEYVKEELEAIVNQLFFSYMTRVRLKTYSKRGLKEIAYTSEIDYEEMNPSTEYINKFSQPLKKYKISEIRIENLNNQTIEKKVYEKTLKQILSNIKITRNIDGKVSEGKIIEEALKIYKHLKGDKIINQDFIETRNRSERNERLLQTIIEQASTELKNIKKRKNIDYRVLEDEKKSSIITKKFRDGIKEILNSNYFVEHKETNIYKNIIARSRVEELVQKFSLESKLMYRKLNFENQMFKKIIQRDGIRNTEETTLDMTSPKMLFTPNSTSEKSEGIFHLLLKNILKSKSIISLTKVSEIRKLQNETEYNLYKHLKADNKLIVFSDTLKRNFLNEVIEKYHTFENKLKTELTLENKNEETKTAKLAIEKNIENEIVNTTNYKMIKNVKYRKINRGNIDNAKIIMGSEAGLNSQSTINQVLKEELIDSTVMEFKKQIAHKKTEGTSDKNRNANDYEEIVKRLENEKATLTSSQIDDLVEEIYWKLEKRIRFERQRAGL